MMSEYALVLCAQEEATVYLKLRSALFFGIRECHVENLSRSLS